MLSPAPRALACALSILLTLPGLARAQADIAGVEVVRGAALAASPVAARRGEAAGGEPETGSGGFSRPAAVTRGWPGAPAARHPAAVAIFVDARAIAPYGRLKIEIRRDRPRHHVWWAWTRAYREHYGHYGL